MPLVLLLKERNRYFSLANSIDLIPKHIQHVVSERKVCIHTEKKCHINSKEHSRLTEVKTASAIRETARIFLEPEGVSECSHYSSLLTFILFALIHDTRRQTETFQNTKIIL